MESKQKLNSNHQVLATQLTLMFFGPIHGVSLGLVIFRTCKFNSRCLIWAGDE